METKHLRYDEIRNRVVIVHEAGDIDLGPLDACDDEMPSMLSRELAELRGLVGESLEYGRACEATAGHADSLRHSPEGWK